MKIETTTWPAQMETKWAKLNNAIDQMKPGDCICVEHDAPKKVRTQLFARAHDGHNRGLFRTKIDGNKIYILRKY